MKTTDDSIFSFLEHCGGSEMFSFYLTDDDGKYITDYNGHYIPDVDRAYKFGNELKEQLANHLESSIDIQISTNIVRMRLLNQVPV